MLDNLKGVRGRKVTIRTETNIRKTEDYVRRHRNASTRHIGSFLNVSNFTDHKILT